MTTYLKSGLTSDTKFTKGPDGKGGIFLSQMRSREIDSTMTSLKRKEFGIKNIGLGARDTLRLEMGYCLYGNDINDTTSPIEAGLGWITKFTPEKDFINKAELLRQKKEGVSKKLVGFKMVEMGIPRHGYPIVDASGNVIGEVTSGTMSPSLKIPVGMGYVPTAVSKEGSEIFVKIRDKSLKAEVVKLPFYKV